MIGEQSKSRRAIRWERKRLRLGIPNAECIDCHRFDIRYLHLVGPKTRIDVPTGSIICGNCRKKRSKWRPASLKRKVSTFEKAGYPDPQCVTCGEPELRTLELHHLEAAVNSDLLVPLCVNCHAIQSDMQEDAPIDFRLPDPNRRPLVLQAAFEFGLGSILIAIAAIESTDKPSYSIALGLIAIVLIGWAIWNISADKYFSQKWGLDYAAGVPIKVPQ